ncbi:hypothetical protein SORBI_3002G226600 [Sorghum bicolor]|uniref:Uncharacterized protein n=1 Tax=Sorghum bicolor TaxID=4558 RepID=A0A1B6QCZ2_SORBI|nr:hypothetical protein SORBI_3002G226600 [Sorghum bicolor]
MMGGPGWRQEARLTAKSPHKFEHCGGDHQHYATGREMRMGPCVPAAAGPAAAEARPAEACERPPPLPPRRKRTKETPHGGRGRYGTISGR